MEMPKLILTLDGALLGEFPLEGRCTTIGRKASNDIQIDNLAVSGEHARVIVVGDESCLEDMGSTNGSMLNGLPVTRQVLQKGDVIGIGRYQLSYVTEASAKDASVPGAHANFENTILVHRMPSADAAHASALHELPAAAPANPADEEHLPPPARVQVLNGSATGKELFLSKTLTTLGKPGVQVAVITRRPHGYFITHVDGQDHPAINGVRIGAQSHELSDHDVIEVAGVKMEFYLA